VQRLLAQRQSDATGRPPLFIQTKLSVGPADDQYEREADQVANQVMTMPDKVQRQGEEEEEIQTKRDYLQRQGEEEEEEIQTKRDYLQRQGEEEEEEVQTKRDYLQRAGDLSGSFEVGGEMEDAIRSQKGGGQPLPDATRDFFESRFGRDFSGVRVHDSGSADALSRSLQSRAFTTGTDIFFRQGTYNPANSTGRELLAHELTHVIQQGGANIKEKSETE
jgi:hypothetical protein